MLFIASAISFTLMSDIAQRVMGKRGEEWRKREKTETWMVALRCFSPKKASFQRRPLSKEGNKSLQNQHYVRIHLQNE
jgi:hypothetical protein